MALNVSVIARGLSQQKDVLFAHRVKIELNKNPNSPIHNKWLASMGKAARKCNLCEELLARKPNCLFELHRGSVPWEELPATFNNMELPANKTNCIE